jgi:hypothetical protein
VIATRVIREKDLVRAAEINDAIALEFNEEGEGALTVGRQLGVNILEAAMIGARHAQDRFQTPQIERHDAMEATTHAFTMGVLVGLRAVEVIGRE